MAKQNPLNSLDDYSRFIAVLVNRSTVLRSTLIVWSDSPDTGVAEGEILFSKGFRLRVLEELDFEAQLITGYSYEVHYLGEKVYWYDDYPHPHDLTLAATYPHHKHVPPDIKHHRVPAPDIHHDCPNLPTLLAEIKARLAQEGS
jgi:hypothetical protein